MGKLKLKSLSVLLLSAVMAVSCLAAVSASDNTGVDADRLGSITISLTENSNIADVSDGVLQLYQAATVKVLSGYMYYDYTDDFYGCTASLDDLEESYYPDELIDWIEENDIEATASAVPDDGIVVFKNLSLGVYLVTQREASEGYYDILPFVITVPMQEGDTWIYDVSAAPKLELVSPENSGDGDGTDSGDDTGDGSHNGNPDATLESETESDSDSDNESDSDFDVDSHTYPESESEETEEDEQESGESDGLDHSTTGLEPNYGEETESETDSNSRSSSDVQSYNGGNSTNHGNDSEVSTNTSTPSSTSTTSTSTPSSTSTPTNTSTSSSSDTASGTPTSSTTDSGSSSGTSNMSVSDAIDDSLYKGDASTPSQVQTGDNTRFIFLGIAAVVIVVLIVVGVRLSRGRKKENQEEE